MWPFSLFKKTPPEESEGHKLHSDMVEELKNRRTRTINSTITRIMAIRDDALGIIEEGHEAGK